MPPWRWAGIITKTMVPDDAEKRPPGSRSPFALPRCADLGTSFAPSPSPVLPLENGRLSPVCRVLGKTKPGAPISPTDSQQALGEGHFPQPGPYIIFCSRLGAAISLAGKPGAASYPHALVNISNVLSF